MKKVRIKDVSALSLFTKTQISEILADINQTKNYLQLVPTVSELHKSFNYGLSVVQVAGIPEDDTFPYAAGVLMHIQRLGRGNATNSQHIHHIFFDLDNNAVYYRKGRGNGTTVPMGNWLRFNMTSI